MFERVAADDSQPTAVYVVLTIWCVLLAPWLLVALMGTGMALEGGETFEAWYFIVSMWSFPLFVAVAFLFRRRRPLVVLLPLASFGLLLLEQFVYLATTHK